MLGESLLTEERHEVRLVEIEQREDVEGRLDRRQVVGRRDGEAGGERVDDRQSEHRCRCHVVAAV